MRRAAVWPGVLLIAVLVAVSAVPASPPARSPAAAREAVFTDRAKECGLSFSHRNGMTGKLYMPEIMGPGVALLDYDNDGDMDVFLVQGGPLRPGDEAAVGTGSRLFRNDLRVRSDGK